MDAERLPSVRNASKAASPRSQAVLAMLGAVVAVPLLLLFLGAGLYFTSNESRVAPALEVERWPAVADGKHNYDPDIVFWNGSYWLVHCSADSAFGDTESRLRLWRSQDARTWTRVREFYIPGKNLQAACFASISRRLFIYTHLNAQRLPSPHQTHFTFTEDGVNWEPLAALPAEGWLLGRPRSADERLWYAPAWRQEKDRLALLRSRNGRQWEEAATIHEGDLVSEGDIQFLPDGRLLAVARLDKTEGYFGSRDAGTLIASAAAPFAEWSKAESKATRLDAPSLFLWGNTAYALGRRNPDAPGILQDNGSLAGRKRTALYRVTPEALEWLSDLSSGGDTGHAGVVVQQNELYVTYYSSPLRFDWVWGIGMMKESDVHVARIGLDSLGKLSPR